MVPAVQCGAIIGTGGFRIKEIRETTGCLVKIGREHLPRSTEKLITLSGTPDIIRDTIEKICQGLFFIYKTLDFDNYFPKIPKLLNFTNFSKFSLFLFKSFFRKI